MEGDESGPDSDDIVKARTMGRRLFNALAEVQDSSWPRFRNFNHYSINPLVRLLTLNPQLQPTRWSSATETAPSMQPWKSSMDSIFSSFECSSDSSEPIMPESSGLSPQLQPVLYCMLGIRANTCSPFPLFEQALMTVWSNRVSCALSTRIVTSCPTNTLPFVRNRGSRCGLSLLRTSLGQLAAWYLTS